MATDPTCKLMAVPDLVGAFPLHAIIVANTSESTVLAADIYRANPRLLMQVHVLHRAGFPLFTGESSLHIAAANEQETLLCTLIELAVQHLTADEARTLFRSQASGVFFDDMPMRVYGGTPLAYACVFSLRRAILLMLETRLVCLNDRSDACVITGFLPIHVVVANSLESMYDFLSKELPEEFRALTHEQSSIGRLLSMNVHGLRPMQLAGKLGDHDMVKFILRKQCTILWVWGPVTQHSINLAGVDSASERSGALMELIARTDASKECCSLVLDSFLQGLLYKLFLAKWARYGYKLHYAILSLHLLVLTMLITMSMSLKISVSTQDSCKPMAVFTIIVILIITFIEVWLATLFWRKNRGEGDARLCNKTMKEMLTKWLKQHSSFILTIAHVLALASCLIVLFGNLTDPVQMVEVGSGAALQGRRLKSGGNSAEGGLVTSIQHVILDDLSEMLFAGDVEEQSGMGWILMAFGILSTCLFTAAKLFSPFESLNVFLLSVTKMLKRDLVIFMILFGYFMGCFFFTLYVLYPRTGDIYLPMALPFNKWHSAVRSMVELALVGSPVLLNLEVDNFETLSTSQVVAVCLWLAVYVFYMLFALILMLNLLIAMLSFTFDTVRTEATLQCRTAFAQCILRLELLADALDMDTHVGEKKGDGYSFDFRSIIAVSEEASECVSDDPFAKAPRNSVQGGVARLEEKMEGLLEEMAEIKVTVNNLRNRDEVIPYSRLSARKHASAEQQLERGRAGTVAMGSTAMVSLFAKRLSTRVDNRNEAAK